MSEGRTSSMGAPPRPLRGVIFDLDDTLVLSTVNYAKFKTKVIERIRGYEGDDAPYTPTETIVAIMARFEGHMRDSGTPEKEIRRRLAEMDRIMDSVELERVSETAAIEGAQEVLSLLHERGVKVGVLTRGCDEYADAALKRAGISGLVDATECRNSDTRPKPDPESYEKLARALGLRTDETIFVGDHPIDAQCARNAGVYFVGVGTGDVPEDVLVRAGADLYFADVGQMRGWLERVLEE